MQNQMSQMDLQDQMNMRKLAPNYVQKDDSGKVTGYDTQGYFNGLLQAAVNPTKITAMQNQYAQASKNWADAGTAQIELQNKKNDQAYQSLEGVRSVATAKNPDPQAAESAYQAALSKLKSLGLDTSKYPPSFQQVGPEGLTQFEASLGLHKQILADAKDVAGTQESTAKAANENAQAALAQIKVNLAKNSKPGDFDSQIDQVFDPKQNSGSNRMAKAMVNGALGRGDFEGAKQVLDQAYQSQQDVQKEIATATNPQIQAGKAATAAAEAQATQPYKIEQAAAEGKARQLIQGMTEPVYAYVPQTGGPPQKTLMSKTDALQAGIKTMLPVTEKEVGDDTMLINRLGDVHQKIAEYEQSLRQPISSSDKTNMAALLDSQKLRIGAFGTEFPAARFDAMLQGENLHGLSGPARDQLVAYRNVREAIVGYQRVLSGSGKSSDAALQLNEQTMPDPSISDPDFSARSITAFKKNLNVVGQGLPTLPGVKSPEQWEQEVTAPKGGPQSLLRSFPQGGMSSLAALLVQGQ